MKVHYYKGQERMKVLTMIDLVLVKKDMLRCLSDVRAVRGMGLSLLHHCVVL